MVHGRGFLGCLAGVCALAAYFGPGMATAAESSPPSELVTGPAEVSAKGAVLHGKLNPGGLRTTAFFEYNQQACDESKKCIKKKATKPLTGSTQQEVRAVKVKGLKAGERYDVRLVAHNRDGTIDGPEIMFTAE
jgi:hypothetical protein